MNMKNYNIHNDKSYQKFLTKKPKLSETTRKGYEYSVTRYCKTNKKTLHEIITEQRIEQRSRIENGVIIEYDADYSTIDTYQQNYIDFLRNNNYSNNSIMVSLLQVNSVLKTLGLKVPTLPQMEDDSKKWYVLQQEDIEYVLSFAITKHRAIIRLLCETGMRREDALSLTIRDYIKATHYHHNCTELEDFLENCKKDMMAYWKYYPKKTSKRNILHMTYSSKYTHHEIMTYLQDRYNKEEDLHLNSILFPMRYESLTNAFRKHSKKLYNYHQQKLENKLCNDGISKETYDEKIKQIPNFHPHGLRKFYITTIAMNCSNPRAIALLEGHKPWSATDSNYIDNKNLEKMVYDEYMKALPILSLNRNIVVENRIQEQENEIRKLRSKTEKLEKYFRELYDIAH